ncbi:hypothetical protein [Verrucosispora sp. NA02020]|uniref:hypothetical protein n=1 Tax=Verrucosispora sp. NA02020 TaxID=2742132 RepID=UPI001590A150|nr:hypothetical protein [Verrucosispora sp. NA02020]QKW17618.1 hypothetical protein HUT12_32455 [Verrucosispora sp. NA02020]
MIFFDVLVWLAVAKFAVLLLEDAAYAVRGKQSPRRQARARHQAAQQKGGQSKTGDSGTSIDGTPPAGGHRRSGGTTLGAADGYLAGLIEDATERARASRRRAAARKRGTQAVDGVVVDVDEQGRWYADCDLCGWHSRPYRIEANALGAGRDHTRTEHPDQYTGQPEPTGDPTESPAPADVTEESGRPALRVIPGGAQDAPPARPAGPPPADAAPAANATTVDQPPARPRVRHEGHYTRCGRCGEVTGPTPMMPRHCFKCGAGDERLEAVTAADIAASHPARYGWRCPRCGARKEGLASFEVAELDAASHTCPTPTEPATDAGHQDSGTTAGDDQHHPTGVPMAPDGSTTSTNDSKELHMNLEATGPEEIRAAFTQAAEAAGENAETIGGIAGVMTEAADRYESLEMAASTVGHLRDAAEQFAAAQAALNTAQEELQAALADFNAKDGQVADAVTETGGNVANKEVLVG